MTGTRKQDGGAAPVEIDLLAYAAIIFRSRFRIAAVTCGAAVLSAVISLVLPKTYRADATILPNDSNGVSEFQRLAQMAGMPFGESRNSSHLFPDILASRRIIRDVIMTRYAVPDAPDSSDLLAYWYPETDKPPRELMEDAIRRMRTGVLSVATDELTGIIHLGVVTGDPRLSADIANAFISRLDRYNREYRKNKAKEQRAFVQERVDEVAADLDRAENRLRSFREKNRRLIDSPALLLEQERLIRDVELNSKLYGELKKQLEIVKIEEVKNTPVIDVLDHAAVPVKRFAPKRRVIVIVATFAALLLSVLYVVLLNIYRDHYRPRLRERAA